MNKAKYFIKDYRMPLYATAVFAVALFALLILRAYDRSVLAAVLGNNKSDNKDYATLLSKDKTDSFKKNEYGSAEEAKSNNTPATSTTQQQTTTSSFTISSPATTTSSPPPTTTTGSTTPPPTVAPPFTAQIMNIRKIGDTPVDCGGVPNPTPSQCFRRYYFSSDISTYNGPGTVAYRWQVSVPDSNSTGSFTAGSDQGLTSVNKVVAISCATPPGDFQVQIGLTSPNMVVSEMLSIHHDCGGSPTFP